MKDYFRVLSYAGKDKRLMLKAVILLTFSVLFSVAPFFIVSTALSKIIEGTHTLPLLLGLAAAVFGCLFFRDWLNGLGLDASHVVAYKTLAGMRKKVAEKQMKMSMGDNQSFGAAAAKKNFVENIEEMELVLAHAMPEGFANLFTFLIVTATMFIVDWRMGLAGFGTIILGFIPLMLMMVDGVKRMKPWYAAGDVMNKNIIEYVSGMEVIKVFGQQSRSFKKYSDSVEEYRKSTASWYKASNIWMTSIFVIMPAALLIMLPVGVALIVAGSITPATIILSLLLGMSMGIPALRLLNFMPQFPQLSYKARKIESMFDIPDLEEGTLKKTNGFDVEFRDVTFAYKETDVIKDLSLKIPENSITALIGESGAGKSTLAKLIVRFWDVQKGAVTVGGVDIKNLTADALAEMVSYVSQDNFLFNTSIMENIRYGKQSASDEEVIAMAKAAQCHEFILETENGYKTIVGSSGDKLSGGQKQRICIARALLKNAPIVILDEATSFTDPENEDKIQEALSKLIKGKTVIIVAHRLSTIVDADNIVLLERGEISAQGKHKELLAKSTLYKKLWDAHVEALDWDIGGGVNV